MTTKRTLGTYSCGRCSKQFKRSDHLLRHKQSHDNSLRFSCTHCGKRFSRKDVRDKHTKIHNEEPKPNSASLSPTHLIEWLFTESPPSDMISPSNIFDQLNFSDFPEMLNQHIVDERKRQQLVSLIPSLELNPDFGLAQIENCIECYWLLYHSQYPILHRPSFNVSEAHPLLILAMVMMGATMRGAMGLSNLQNPIELSNQIAIPLRWLIFSSYSSRLCRRGSSRAWLSWSLLKSQALRASSTKGRIFTTAPRSSFCVEVPFSEVTL